MVFTFRTVQACAFNKPKRVVIYLFPREHTTVESASLSRPDEGLGNFSAEAAISAQGLLPGFTRDALSG